MNNKYTAVIQNAGDWWIGWIEEVPGVNSQEKTHEELVASLKEALSEAIRFNREEAIKCALPNYIEEPILV